MHPEVLEPAMKQARHGRLGRSELGGDLGQRPALQVMQLDRAALALGERGQSFGHSQQLFLANGMLARRRLIGGEPLFQARRRLVQCLVERPFAADVALASRQLAQHVGQVVAQDRTQPRRGLGLGFRPRWIVTQPLVGFQERLLDDPREVNLVAQPRGDLEPGQQPQVGAEPLQVVRPGAAGEPFRVDRGVETL